MCAGLGAGFTCTDTATAFRFGGGYQFTPNLGIEANYGILGKPTMSGTVLGVAINGEAKLNTLQVAATGTYPVADAFSLIGKLGIARTTLDVSASGGGFSSSSSATSTKLAYGIGAQYDISKTLGVRAQYENLGEVGDVNTTGTTKVSLISAGVVFKF
jgi:OOP family OmpA-OmpF porin